MLNNNEFIFDTVIAGYPIKLKPIGNDSFIVYYGESFKHCYSYEDAAKELGECIMHALNCEGVLEC
jgi:hypothetical protein